MLSLGFAKFARTRTSRTLPDSKTGNARHLTKSRGCELQRLTVPFHSHAGRAPRLRTRPAGKKKQTFRPKFIRVVHAICGCSKWDCVANPSGQALKGKKKNRKINDSYFKFRHPYCLYIVPPPSIFCLAPPPKRVPTLKTFSVRPNFRRFASPEKNLPQDKRVPRGINVLFFLNFHFSRFLVPRLFFLDLPLW